MLETFTFTTAGGRKVHARIEIADIRKAALALARRATSQGAKRVTALDGAIVLDILE